MYHYVFFKTRDSWSYHGRCRSKSEADSESKYLADQVGIMQIRIITGAHRPDMPTD